MSRHQSIGCFLAFALVLTIGCGKHEANKVTEDLTDEVRARMTAGAEKYRLEGWKSRSIEHTNATVALTQENVAIVALVPAAVGTSMNRGAGMMRMQGSFEMDPETLTPKTLELKIDAKSVQTPRDIWTAYIQNKEMLNTDEFPTIDFKTKSIGEGKRIAERKVEYPLTGELTIAGQTREVSFPLEFETSDGRMAFSCEHVLDLAKFAPADVKTAMIGPCKFMLRFPWKAFVPDDEEAIQAELSTATERGGGGGRAPFDPEAFFKARDADSDGVLKGDEIPERMKARVETMDKDQDGAISLEELRSAPRPQRPQ